MLDRFWPISLECHRCPVDLFCNAEHAQSTRFRSLLRRSSSTHSLANASNKGQLRLTGIFWGQPTACKTEETVGISTYLAFPQSSQASSTSASMYAQIWAPLPCASFPANLSSAATILVFRCRAVTDCSTFFPLVELWMSSASPTRHHRHLSSVTASASHWQLLDCSEMSHFLYQSLRRGESEGSSRPPSNLSSPSMPHSMQQKHGENVLFNYLLSYSPPWPHSLSSTVFLFYAGVAVKYSKGN